MAYVLSKYCIISQCEKLSDKMAVKNNIKQDISLHLHSTVHLPDTFLSAFTYSFINVQNNPTTFSLFIKKPKHWIAK